MTTKQPEVLHEVDDHMAMITLNHPERMDSLGPGLLGGWTGCTEQSTEDSQEGLGAFREQRAPQLQGR